MPISSQSIQAVYRPGAHHGTVTADIAWAASRQCAERFTEIAPQCAALDQALGLLRLATLLVVDCVDKVV